VIYSKDTSCFSVPLSFPLNVRVLCLSQKCGFFRLWHKNNKNRRMEFIESLQNWLGLSPFLSLCNMADSCHCRPASVAISAGKKLELVIFYM